MKSKGFVGIILAVMIAITGMVTITGTVALASDDTKTVSIGIGEKYTFNVDNVKSFKSSDKSIAKVDKEKGTITGKSKGTATITATQKNGSKVKLKVKVKAAPDSIKLTKTKLTLKVGETYKLKTEKAPSNSASKLKWSSSDKTVATVSSSGKVTAVGTGTATITVKTFNKHKATCKVTVKWVSGSSTATATPKPTATPKATATPKSTATPKPTSTLTPSPTATVVPTPTPYNPVYTTQEITIKQEIPRSTSIIRSADVHDMSEVYVQEEGCDGESEAVYLVEYKDGVEINRTQISYTITKQQIPRVVVYPELIHTYERITVPYDGCDGAIRDPEVEDEAYAWALAMAKGEMPYGHTGSTVRDESIVSCYTAEEVGPALKAHHDVSECVFPQYKLGCRYGIGVVKITTTDPSVGIIDVYYIGAGLGYAYRMDD